MTASSAWYAVFLGCLALSRHDLRRLLAGQLGQIYFVRRRVGGAFFTYSAPNPFVHEGGNKSDTLRAMQNPHLLDGVLVRTGVHDACTLALLGNRWALWALAAQQLQGTVRARVFVGPTF